MKSLFEIISNEYNFSILQKNQYLKYIDFLISENEKFNLTAISNLDEILHYHLIDSLKITSINLLDKKKSIADIGSGAGIPGILLAIYYPNIIFYLIEVTQKKINFLKNVIILLDLKNCVIINDDFLTFIRKKEIKIDTFIARASLSLKEIINIYQIQFYFKSDIIYWGSLKWRDDPKHNVILNNKLISYTEYIYKIEKNETVKKLNYIKIKKIK
jgi:16S rRNA (guanine527-N7)-methyltransferase